MRAKFRGSWAVLGLLALSVYACEGNRASGEAETGGGGGTGGEGGSSEGGGGGTGGEFGPGGTGGDETNWAFTRIVPSQGPLGTEVRLEGRGFEPSAVRNRVLFGGGAVATVLEAAADGSWLVTKVPTGAQTGVVSVLVEGSGGVVRVDGPVFTVTETQRPTIASVQPGTAYAGVETTHRLLGTGFGTSSTVEIDGQRLHSRVLDDGELEFSLPKEHGFLVGSHDVTVRLPSGVISEPYPLLVDEPLDLLSAQAASATEILLRFSHLAPEADDVENSVSIIPGLRIERVERVASRPELLRIVTEHQGQPGYGIYLTPWTTNAEGRPMRMVEAKCQGFGIVPLRVGEIHARGCGAGGLSSAGAVSAVGPWVVVAEELGNQYQLLQEDRSLGDFLGSDGESIGLHRGSATAAGCPGGEGSEGGLFAPRGALQSDGGTGLLFADTGHRRILRFDPMAIGPSLEEVYSGGEKPVLIEASAGRMIVATEADELIQVAADTRRWEALGGRGSGAGEFRFGIEEGFSPGGATLANGVLLIAEPANHRVQALEDGVSQGWIGSGNEHFSTEGACCTAGDTPGHFVSPVCVALDLAGGFWVADRAGAHGGRLMRFLSDGSLHLSINLAYPPAGCAIGRRNEVVVSSADDASVYWYRI